MLLFSASLRAAVGAARVRIRARPSVIEMHVIKRSGASIKALQVPVANLRTLLSKVEMLAAATRTTIVSSPRRLLGSSQVPFRSLIIPSARPSTLVVPAFRKSINFTSAFSTSASRLMSAHHGESTLRPEPDKVLQDIANYVHGYKIDSPLAFETARLCLIDTIGCGLEALRFPECTKLLGPVVEGTIVPNGLLCLPTLPFSTILIRIVTIRYSRSRNESPARSHPWRLQHWHSNPLARLQRLFLSCRMFVTPSLFCSH